MLSLLLSTSLSITHGLPQGFISEIVSSRTKAITGIFAPNPRREDLRPMLLLGSKKGRVKVLENPDEYGSSTLEEDAATIIIDLSDDDIMCTNGERGLQSVVVHPDFGYDNLYVYLYGCYKKDGPRNVLARYTMNAETLQLENEEILLAGAPLNSRVHNGGAMIFSDGYLYLTIGDDNDHEKVQNHRNLLGTLLRLNDDGTIPNDNPFADQGIPCGQSKGVVSSKQPDDVFCSEIYSWGFRNPVRIALDTTSSIYYNNEENNNSTRFTISDVGDEYWEEISWGGSDYKGKNYGWPVSPRERKDERVYYVVVFRIYS